MKEGDEYILSLSRGREILSAKPKGEYVISLTNNKDIVFSHPYPNTNRLYPALSLDSALNDFSKTIPPRAKFQLIPPIQPSPSNIINLGIFKTSGKITFQKQSVQKLTKIAVGIFSGVGFLGLIGGIISSSEDVKLLTIELAETSKNYTFLQAHLSGSQSKINTFISTHDRNETTQEISTEEKNIFHVQLFNTTKQRYYSRNSDYF